MGASCNANCNCGEAWEGGDTCPATLENPVWVEYVPGYLRETAKAVGSPRGMGTPLLIAECCLAEFLAEFGKYGWVR